MLDALEHAFGIESGSLLDSRAILADYGNMSAVTLLFVLERALREGALATDRWRRAAAFRDGAGLYCRIRYARTMSALRWIVGFIALQRVAELAYAARNTRALTCARRDRTRTRGNTRCSWAARGVAAFDACRSSRRIRLPTGGSSASSRSRKSLASGSSRRLDLSGRRASSRFPARRWSAKGRTHSSRTRITRSFASKLPLFRRHFRPGGSRVSSPFSTPYSSPHGCAPKTSHSTNVADALGIYSVHTAYKAK